MFTLSGFSTFYFILSAFILFLILFEDKLIALEEKHDQRRKNKRK